MQADKSRVWLSPPHMGGSEQQYIQEAFSKNWIAPLGPNVAGFEHSLEHYLGNGVHVAALSSGTAALHLALIMLGVGVGDEVLCQSFTFAASVNPVLYCGATPVLVGSETGSWNICPHYLEEAIKNRFAKGTMPKAIIAVHLYGMPYKHKEIKAVADKYNIPVIEDSAEALGSTWQGKPCGTLGDISLLSFNGNKIITTSGGGALVLANATDKQRAIFLATQAKDDAPHYEHSTLGYNYRMSNICAGIGRGQMEVLAQRVAQKREVHKKYTQYFSNVAGVTVFSEYEEDVQSNHWLSCIVVNPEECGGKTAEGLRHALEKENIESRPLWKPMHLQPLYRNNLYVGGDEAEKLFGNGLCLPSGTDMNYKQWERIFSCLDGYFK